MPFKLDPMWPGNRRMESRPLPGTLRYPPQVVVINARLSSPNLPVPINKHGKQSLISAVTE